MLFRWFDPRTTDLTLGVVIGLAVAIVWHVIIGS